MTILERQRILAKKSQNKNKPKSVQIIRTKSASRGSTQESGPPVLTDQIDNEPTDTVKSKPRPSNDEKEPKQESNSNEGLIEDPIFAQIQEKSFKVRI